MPRRQQRRTNTRRAVVPSVPVQVQTILWTIEVTGADTFIMHLATIVQNPVFTEPVGITLDGVLFTGSATLLFDDMEQSLCSGINFVSAGAFDEGVTFELPPNDPAFRTPSGGYLSGGIERPHPQSAQPYTVERAGFGILRIHANAAGPAWLTTFLQTGSWALFTPTTVPNGFTAVQLNNTSGTFIDIDFGIDLVTETDVQVTDGPKNIIDNDGNWLEPGLHTIP